MKSLEVQIEKLKIDLLNNKKISESKPSFFTDVIDILTGYRDRYKKIDEAKSKVINAENGIKRLKTGCEKGYRIALLGAMQDPIRCHRSILVGRELVKNGFKVNHILDDYSIASQNDIEKSILEKYFEDRNQMTIDYLLGTNKSEEEMIKEGYRLANKEIGYRIEHLDLNSDKL